MNGDFLVDRVATQRGGSSTGTNRSGLTGEKVSENRDTMWQKDVEQRKGDPEPPSSRLELLFDMRKTEREGGDRAASKTVGWRCVAAAA
jgi:hypothetical protein